MLEKMKQVAVRMEPSLHRKILKEAKRQQESFSEFVRQAVRDRADVLAKWTAPKEKQ